MRLEIQGRIVEVGDEFARLSPEEQQRTVNEIAASITKPQAAAPSRAEQFFQAARPETAAGAYGLSTANSMLFGIPEMAARAMGAGPAIDATRQEYPMATTAGDITGLISPAALGAKMMSKGMSALSSRFGGKAAGTAEDTMRALKQTEEANRAAEAARVAQQPGVVERTARTAVRQAPNVIGGTMGAQVGAGALGGARSEGEYGGGFQQGAQTFRNVATNLPGMQLIPGAQTTMGAVTSVVPAVQGYGSLAAQYMDIKQRSREDQIREEAWRRAMRGPQ